MYSSLSSPTLLPSRICSCTTNTRDYQMKLRQHNRTRLCAQFRLRSAWSAWQPQNSNQHAKAHSAATSTESMPIITLKWGLLLLNTIFAIFDHPIQITVCSQFTTHTKNIYSSQQYPTHKRFKRTLIYYDIDTQSANFWGNPLRQATKRHLN